MTSNELIERCEAATGPDRLLDAEIYCIKVVENNKITYRARPGRKPGTVVCYYFDNGPLTHGTRNAPEFTASLDAAMTLNPGWLLRGLHQECSYWYCDFICAGREQPAHGNAKTAALALTAAALRARATQPPVDEGGR